jgi:hypothetical protein
LPPGCSRSMRCNTGVAGFGLGRTWLKSTIRPWPG